MSAEERLESRGALTLEIEREFDAPRDLVWKAWTEPEHLKRWSAPKDFTVTGSEGDLRVGGRWRGMMRSPDGEDYVAVGEYLEIDAPRRLVFTHSWEASDGTRSERTIITITLTERDGKTKMIFEQTGFSDAEVRDSHAEGWSEAFDNLHDHVERTRR